MRPQCPGACDGYPKWSSGLISEVCGLISDLVQIDTTSGNTGEDTGLRTVANWLSDHVDCQVELGEDQTGTATHLLVSPAKRDRTPLLLFAAHIDVVPVTDPDAWVWEPFGGVVSGGRMYGRGASDMKSGLAAAMVAVAELLAVGAPVALAVSRGEELGCIGVPQLVPSLRRYTVGAVIVPESTKNDVVLGHRGALWLTVRTAGIARHGSAPESGKNAVLAMAQVLLRLNSLPLMANAELGAESVNVGAIHGGSVYNIVPDSCEARIDIRTVGASTDRIVRWWHAQPEIAAVEVDVELQPVWTKVDHPWLAELDAPISTVPATFFTDASVLESHLPDGTPIVIWGPGDPSAVHAVDEFVDLDSVYEAVRLYLSAGERWMRSMVGSSPDDRPFLETDEPKGMI